MRESIGTVSLLNFVLFFIFLVFAFLAGSMSYYKAFRVNNLMVSAIEKYEGFNEYAKEEIDVSVSNLGYENVDFECPALKDNAYLVKLGASSVEEWHKDDKARLDADKGYSGYCVYRRRNDQPSSVDPNVDKAFYTDQYDVYEVVTIISFKFPVVQDLIKLRVSAKTDRIYNFEASSAALNGEGWSS